MGSSDCAINYSLDTRVNTARAAVPRYAWGQWLLEWSWRGYAPIRNGDRDVVRNHRPSLRRTPARPPPRRGAAERGRTVGLPARLTSDLPGPCSGFGDIPAAASARRRVVHTAATSQAPPHRN